MGVSMGRLGVLGALLALLFALAACGDDSDSGEGSGDAPVERADDPANLPAGWRTVENQASGFTVGAPPGWSDEPQEGGQGTVLRSPDKLVAVSISADRSAGALALDPEEFASRTAKALASGDGEKGSESPADVEIGPASPVDSPYEGASVAALKTTSEGHEGIEVAVLRRPEVAVYVLAARGNADSPSAFADSRTFAEITASLRGQPPS